MKILVTGVAGFIGSALAEALCKRGHEVVGIDNLNNYYNPRLKLTRLNRAGIYFPETLSTERILSHSGSNKGIIECPSVPNGKIFKSTKYSNFKFIRIDITNKGSLDILFANEGFDIVINLAAQAGVRYSIENPMAYIESNIVGFMNLLECAREYPIRHFVYASSSSVYGGNTKVPFSETDKVDAPVSVYAATKKADELLANVYSNLFHIPTTGLRFFTVYGPWGRPDMAPMLFADAISAEKPIKVFNHGEMSRDFTYIDDIIEGIARVVERIPTNTRCTEIFNIGHGEPMQLMDFIHELETTLGKKAKMEMLPMQKGDVYTTFADTTKLNELVNYKPQTTLHEGVKKFVEWYSQYNNL